MNNEQHVSLCILANSTSKVESTFHISDCLGYSSLKSKRTLRSQILPIITSHKTRLDGSETSRSKTTLPSIQSYIVFFPPHFSFVPLALLSFPIRITLIVPSHSSPPLRHFLFRSSRPLDGSRAHIPLEGDINPLTNRYACLR